MTTNTQLLLDPDSMTYKPVEIDTNYLPFPVYKGKIFDSPHVLIGTNQLWTHDPQILGPSIRTLQYPPDPVYLQLSPPKIIYVTNTVVVDSIFSHEALAKGAGGGLFMIGLGICWALALWGLGRLRQ